MSKKRVLFGLSFVTLAGLASQAGGCLGGSNAATTSDGGGAGGGSSSSGGGGSSSGSGSAEAGDPCTPDPSTIIDDMSGAHGTANATGGYWYTYSDRTVPDSEPPILLSGPDGGAPPGSITPPEGQSFPVSDAGTINGCMWNYREVVGGGENTWGAGFGMDFLSTPPDGGPVPFNTCADLLSLTDAGQIFNVTDIDSGTVGIVQPYDASQWSGISFWGISFTGKPQAVNIQMDDDRTSPWGGVCNPCNYEAPTTPGMTNSCSDNFIKGETFTGTWTQFKIAWSDPLFKTANWSKDGTKQPIDSNKVYNLHFQVTAHPAPAFDLGVAMVQFYK